MSVLFTRRGPEPHLCADRLTVFELGDTALRYGEFGRCTSSDGYSISASNGLTVSYLVNNELNPDMLERADCYVNIAVDATGYDKLKIVARANSSSADSKSKVGYHVRNALNEYFVESELLTTTDTEYEFDISDWETIYVKVYHYMRDIYISGIYLE